MGCCGKIKGAVRLVQAEMLAGSVRNRGFVETRRNACRSCPDCDLGRCMFVPEGGKACGCYVWAKCSISAEKCPAGRWPAG